jgi:hypothetical protein
VSTAGAIGNTQWLCCLHWALGTLLLQLASVICGSSLPFTKNCSRTLLRIVSYYNMLLPACCSSLRKVVLPGYQPGYHCGYRILMTRARHWIDIGLKARGVALWVTVAKLAKTAGAQTTVAGLLHQTLP